MIDPKQLYPEGREAAYELVSNLAGVDSNGNILPPPANYKIDRGPVTWWKTPAASSSFMEPGAVSSRLGGGRGPWD